MVFMTMIVSQIADQMKILMLKSWTLVKGLEGLMSILAMLASMDASIEHATATLTFNTTFS